MAYIVPKLNLNKVPKSVENNSLIFAKNIRLDASGEIHRDYGISPITLDKTSNSIPIDYRELTNRIIVDIIKHIEKEDESSNFVLEFYNYYLDKLKKIINYDDILPDWLGGSCEIVGIIPDSNCFYIFLNGWCIYIDNEEEITEEIPFIAVYNEKDNTFLPCNCNWNYSGGVIDGFVITNLIGETIINIGETTNDGTLVPFKCINLSKSSYLDDETIYTQTPNIPITNLNFVGTFSFVIPNGVYQFFIRYKIRDDFYTDWFPATKELFAGNTNSVNTNFGTLKYVNTHTDADKSFMFNVEHLFTDYNGNYESFQIGFILSHDDTIYARAWKHFDMNQVSVKFDYKATDAEEIEVTDLTKISYQLFNVGNVTSFKNKLYVSNYTETNFNEDLQEYANNIGVTIQEKTSGTESYNGNSVTKSYVGSTPYITGIIVNSTTISLQNTNGVIDRLMGSAELSYPTTKTLLTNSSLNNTSANNAGGRTSRGSIYGFSVFTTRETLTETQNRVSNRIKNLSDYYSGPEFGTNTVESIYVDGVQVNSVSAAISTIYNTIKYLSFNAQFYNNAYTNKSSFIVTFNRSCTYKYKTTSPVPPPEVNSNRAPSITPGGYEVIKEATTTYSQTVTISFSADKNLIETDSVNELLNLTTLVPYQKYKFYVHYVKQTGEITNGYYCNGANAGEVTAPYKPQANAILYPSFTNIKFPDGYIACFFSIFHSGVYSASIFNVKNANNGSSDVAIEGSCIEANTKLIPMGTNIVSKFINGNNVETVAEGTYHYSGDSSIIRYFGGDGIISYPVGSNIDVTGTKLMYAITDYDSQQAVDITLTKCTPFIKRHSNLNPLIGLTYNNPQNLNLLGYICQVSPLSRTRATGYYSDGSSVYKKQSEFDVTVIDNAGYQMAFTELGKYSDSTYKLADFTIISTDIVNIYSNYNLNYLSISDDPKTSNKTYYTVPADRAPTKDTNEANTVSVLWRLLTSLTLSEIYELPSMYKNYTRKIYSPYKDDSIIKFDNTIRSSQLIDDERQISIFKFDADDYYNVPTNRGKVVNLVSVGDSILVHTKDSMFRFTGSNNLSGSTGEIVTNETEPFDTGISELFGSDYGFAGLQNKEDSIITESGYIFFDRDSNVVYMYSGQNRIEKLSDKIEKLFEYDSIKNIHFANDYYNNRFFMCIDFNNSRHATLSFNMLDGVKSFVSLHDFKFNYAFNTKSNCYFLTEYRDNICKIDKTTYGIYESLANTFDWLYPFKSINVQETRINGLYPEDVSKRFTKYLYNTSSIIDVIVNDNYELVKTLNSIQWCSRFIENVFKEVDSRYVESLLMAEPELNDKPCSSIRIYTDTCATNLISCVTKSNDFSLDASGSYEAPRFNQGKWSLNYFRNILNATDKLNYNKDIENYRQSDMYSADNNSLVEGKYFIIRFIFDGQMDFKLETIALNVTNKI